MQNSSSRRVASVLLFLRVRRRFNKLFEKVFEDASSSSFGGGNLKRATDAIHRSEEKPSSSATAGAVDQLDFATLVKHPEGAESPMLHERLAEEGVLQRDEKQVRKRFSCWISFITKSWGKTIVIMIVIAAVVVVVVVITAAVAVLAARRINRGFKSSGIEQRQVRQPRAGRVKQPWRGVFIRRTWVRQNVRFRFVHGNVTKIFLKRVHFHAFMMETHGELQISPDEKETDNVSNEDTVKWFADSLAAK